MTNSQTDLKSLGCINPKQAHLPEEKLNLKESVRLSFQQFNLASRCYPNVTPTSSVLTNGRFGSEKTLKDNETPKRTIRSSSERDLNENKVETRLKPRMKRNYGGLSELSEERRSCAGSAIKNSQESYESKDNASGSDTLTAESDDYENFSDASSDSYSVGEACVTWKNDQNRDEHRLLPLKRLKKGYTSACRRTETLKVTDWTENIAIYDKIISVALDHSAYARSPTSIPTNSPNHIAPRANSPILPDRSISPPVNVSTCPEHISPLANSEHISVNLPTPPVNAPTPPVNLPSLPVNLLTLPVSVPTSGAPTSSERITCPPVKLPTLSERIICTPVKLPTPSERIICSSVKLPPPSERIVCPPVKLPTPSERPPVNRPILPERIICTPVKLPTPFDRITCPPVKLPIPSERIICPPVKLPTIAERIICTPVKLPTPSERIICSSVKLPAPSERIICTPVKLPTPSERIICSPVNLPTLSDRIICTPVKLPTPSERIICPPGESSTTPERVICPPVVLPSLPERIICSPVKLPALPETISPTVNLPSLPQRNISPPLSILPLTERIPTPPPPLIPPPFLITKEPETLPSSHLTTLPLSTELGPIKLKELPSELINIAINDDEKLVEPKATVLKSPVQSVSNKHKTEINSPKSNESKARKVSESKSHLRKRRGRPKGSFKHGLTSVRSYRNILRRSRLGRPLRNVVRDMKADLSVKHIRDKRPVGRPRKESVTKEVVKGTDSKKHAVNAEDTNKIMKASDETIKASNEGEIKAQKKLYKTPKTPIKVIKTTENMPKLEEKQSKFVMKAVKVVENSPKAAETTLQLNEISVNHVNSIVEVGVTQSPTIAIHYESRDPNVRSLDENDTRTPPIESVVVKKPKGRPRLLSILNHIKPQSLLKKKRGRPPKFKPSLLESIRQKAGEPECTIPVPSKVVEETTADPLSMMRNQARNSPNPTLNPSNWLSQLSRRSSLRQVECAFRYREIVVKKQEHFIHILLTSNTRVKNGLNCQVLSELKTALISAKNDEKCHCVMLSGTGGVFCSGIDLISLSIDKTGDTAEKMSSAIRDFCKCLMAFPKPLVAAVNGSAVGLGVSMLPYFDLVYATDKATFYSPYAKLGQVPEGGATYLLPSVMGYARANGLLLEGRKLTATEAYDCGIVTQVLWPATFMEEVIPRVRALANRSLPALESTKALIRYHVLSKLEVILDTECRLLYQHWSSDECRQIIKDFLQNEEVV